MSIQLSLLPNTPFPGELWESKRIYGAHKLRVLATSQRRYAWVHVERVEKPLGHKRWCGNQWGACTCGFARLAFPWEMKLADFQRNYRRVDAPVT